MPYSVPCSRRFQSTSATTETGAGTKHKAKHAPAPSHSSPPATDRPQSSTMRGNPGHCHGNAPPSPRVRTDNRQGSATPAAASLTAPSRPHGPAARKVLEMPGCAQARDPPGDIFLRRALPGAHGAPSGRSDRGVTPRFCSVKPKGIPGTGPHPVPA